MLQSRPHILTKSIVIIIENANKSNGFGQSMGGTSTSRSKGLGYHEIEQEASSLVDISHRQVYCLELGDSIISKSSKKPKVLLNGFLTKYLLTWQKTPSVRLPWAARTCCSAIRPKVPKPVRWYTPWWKAQGKRSRTICLSTACAGGSPIPGMKNWRLSCPGHLASKKIAKSQIPMLIQIHILSNSRPWVWGLLSFGGDGELLSTYITTRTVRRKTRTFRYMV